MPESRESGVLRWLCVVAAVFCLNSLFARKVSVLMNQPDQWPAIPEFELFASPLAGGNMHERWMRLALDEARQALEEDEVPVGAIVVAGERVIASAHNQREQLADPTAHAEMIAITQAASALNSWRLENCVLYVTLEPCPMCAGAILQARVPVVVWGAADAKAGAVESLYQLFEDGRLNHRVEHAGHVLEAECGKLLTEFFREKRRRQK
jgi:tRNA(adenine34) deaminase